MKDSIAAAPARADGYAELRDYALVGDVRCGTDVLETAFTTAGGTVRVTDALTLPDTASPAPGRELVRRIEGLAGSVPMRWSVQPRFGYGAHVPHLARRAGIPVATSGAEAVDVCAWNVGHPQVTDEAVTSRFRADSGSRALIALSYAHQEPLVLPTRADCEPRLDHTTATRRQRADNRDVGGSELPSSRGGPPMAHRSTVHVRRIYQAPEQTDGVRVLVDRVWPRGMTKDKAHLDEWCKQVAPSTELRKWYSHDPERFAEFSRRYRTELKDPERADALAHLRDLAEDQPVTLLTATRHPDISEAEVLAEVLRS